MQHFRYTPRWSEITRYPHLEWWRGKGLAGRGRHVVLQGVGEIVRVRVEEILGEVYQLEEPKISRLSDLPVEMAS